MAHNLDSEPWINTTSTVLLNPPPDKTMPRTKYPRVEEKHHLGWYASNATQLIFRSHLPVLFGPIWTMNVEFLCS